MLKHKSLEELKDCLDVIHQQLQDLFYSKNPNPKHIEKLSGWFDRVAIEIEYRNVLAIKSKTQDEVSRHTYA